MDERESTATQFARASIDAGTDGVLMHSGLFLFLPLPGKGLRMAF
jgi:hypothetical protein